jgi:acetyl-CoA carboxylase biotin carboxyl carrier protein
MDIKKIKELVRLVNNNGLSVLEVSEGDKKIRIEKGGCEAAAWRPAPKAETQKSVKNPADDGETMESAVDFNNIIEVKAPMVGVFYASPQPGSPPFVKIGDRVKKGDVLCIIEAMKLMNEICSETDGEIIDICAENEQVVEYGQTLFKIY